MAEHIDISDSAGKAEKTTDKAVKTALVADYLSTEPMKISSKESPVFELLPQDEEVTSGKPEVDSKIATPCKNNWSHPAVKFAEAQKLKPAPHLTAPEMIGIRHPHKVSQALFLSRVLENMKLPEYLGSISGNVLAANLRSKPQWFEEIPINNRDGSHLWPNDFVIGIRKDLPGRGTSQAGLVSSDCKIIWTSPKDGSVESVSMQKFLGSSRVNYYRAFRHYPGS